MTITRVNLYENLNERDIKKDARRREFDNFYDPECTTMVKFKCYLINTIKFNSFILIYHENSDFIITIA